MCKCCGDQGNKKGGFMKEMMQNCKEMMDKNMPESQKADMMKHCHEMCAFMMSQGKANKEKKDAV